MASIAGASRVRGGAGVVMVALLLVMVSGCATIRVTDPAQTATEQYLMSVAATKAVDQLSAEALRDRSVYVDSTYLTAATQPSAIHSYMLGELRAKLLLSGVRLVDRRDQAQIILEVRSQASSVDRLEYLLGLPAFYAPGGTSATEGIAVATPELAIYKNTRQSGYASIAFVAYWAKTGELVASSGPFVGRTFRVDYFIFGYNARTIGNIPTTDSDR